MQLSKDTISTVLTGVAVLCAVVATGNVVYGKVSARPGIRPGGSMDPVVIKDWAAYATSGHRIGKVDARVTVIEFADFECPVCRNFTNGPLKYIRSKYPDQVAVVFRHWPLSYHRFAYPAARAAECAADQGRFAQYHDLLYAQQDSLGFKSFGAFARESGVADTLAFAVCDRSTLPVAAIEADTKAAHAVGGAGTPTIIVNGLKLAGAPDTAQFDKYIQQALKTP